MVILSNMKKILILIIIFILFLTGCNKNNVNTEYLYDDESYLFGNTTITNKDINDIIVDWLVGNIIITKQESDELIIKEEKDSSLDDDFKFRYLEKENSVDVKFVKSMEQLNYDFRIKNLYLYVPSFVKSITLNSHDAKVKCENITLDSLTIIGDNSSIDLTTSNIITLNINNNSDDIILFNNSFSNVSITSNSSDIGLFINDELKILEIDTSSGNVSLYVNKNLEFAINYQTDSGKFTSKLDYELNDNNYIFNNGLNKYYVKTASGDLKVFEK